MTIRTVRLPLLLLVDVLWAYAAVAVFVAVLSRGHGPAPSLVGVAAVVAGSFALARALQQTELDDAQFRGIGAAASAIALFAIIHAEFAATEALWRLGWIRTFAAGDAHANVVASAIAMTLLWMRGIVRGQQSDDFHGVAGSVALGFVPVAIAAAVAPSVHGPDAFGAIAIAYVVLALGALALYQAPDPDRPLRGYAEQWGIGAGVVLAIAAALAVVAAAIDPAALGVLAPIGKPLAYVAGNAAKYILGPPLAAIGWLLSQIPLPHPQQEMQPLQDMQPGKKPPEQHDTPLWARIVGWILAGGLLALLAVGALIVIWLLFRRFAKQKEQAGERRERVEAESSLGDDLGAALDALARRFRRGPRHTRSQIAVRRLYHEMLERAANEGLGRPPPATPLQFALLLDAHFASDVPSAITDAFAASRYGARDVDEQAVRGLRARWRGLDPRRREQ